jgi:nitrate reductase gamma subunit
MVKFMTWAQGILTLRPGVAALIADANPIFKLHLFLGMTLFLVFPFTRLVHVWSAPIWYLGRQGYQVVRTRQQVAVDSVRGTGPGVNGLPPRRPSGLIRPMPAE